MRASLSRACLLVSALLAGCATGGGARGPAPVKAPFRAPPSPHRIEEVRTLVQAAASRHGVPESLILAVIQVESGFQPAARSAVGARGLMQLMPRTAASLARRLGWESYTLEDPAFNVEAGTAYLAYLLARFPGELELALAAYNAGPTRIEQWQRNGHALSPPVQRYVQAVLAAREQVEMGQAFADEALDRAGLRSLLHARVELYGDRPDEPLPAAPLPAAASVPSLPAASTATTVTAVTTKPEPADHTRSAVDVAPPKSAAAEE